MTFHCPHCRQIVSPTEEGTCPNCGRSLSDQVDPPAPSVRALSCPACGAPVTAHDRGVCPNCHRPIGTGTYVMPPPPGQPERPRPGVGQTFAIIGFTIIGLPSCALGGCFLMFSQGTGPAGQTDNSGLLLGASGIGIFLILLILLILSSRKR